MEMLIFLFTTFIVFTMTYTSIPKDMCYEEVQKTDLCDHPYITVLWLIVLLAHFHLALGRSRADSWADCRLSVTALR